MNDQQKSRDEFVTKLCKDLTIKKHLDIIRGLYVGLTYAVTAYKPIIPGEPAYVARMREILRQYIEDREEAMKSLKMPSAGDNGDTNLSA